MTHVTGIGGLFWRARDPEALGRWYQQHLGITYDGFVWQQQAGPSVVRPFADDTDYFPPDRQFMLNLRVADLDALTADLREAGIEVRTDPAWDSPEVGRFARIHDPEGLPIELWEPAAT
jgi:predicted enzyme related to lactoylglutathione lyase